MGAYECVGVFITEIINGVLGITAQFYQVYGIGVGFTKDDIRFTCIWLGQSTAGKSYVVFGKTNNNAVNLSAIADANTPTGGFVIHGEAWGDRRLALPNTT
jgi:Neuraminidase (sialidase)